MSIKTRLDQLERHRQPQSVYEFTDAQLLQHMGLAPDATDAEVDARVAELLELHPARRKPQRHQLPRPVTIRFTKET